MLENVLFFVGALIVVVIVLKLLRVSVKIIVKLLINAIIGGAALFLLNMLPFVSMDINWLSAIATGIFGLPAVVVIFIISLL